MNNFDQKKANDFKVLNLKIKHKKQTIEYGVIDFASMREAESVLEKDDIFKFFKLGYFYSAKLEAIGKQPPKLSRKKVLKLKINDLSEEQVRALQDLGLFDKAK